MSNEKLNYWYAIGTAFYFKNHKPLGMFQVKGHMNLSALLDNFQYLHIRNICFVKKPNDQ